MVGIDMDAFMERAWANSEQHQGSSVSAGEATPCHLLGPLVTPVVVSPLALAGLLPPSGLLRVVLAARPGHVAATSARATTSSSPPPAAATPSPSASTPAAVRVGLLRARFGRARPPRRARQLVLLPGEGAHRAVLYLQPALLVGVARKHNRPTFDGLVGHAGLALQLGPGCAPARGLVAPKGGWCALIRPPQGLLVVVGGILRSGPINGPADICGVVGIITLVIIRVKGCQRRQDGCFVGGG